MISICRNPHDGTERDLKEPQYWMPEITDCRKIASLILRYRWSPVRFLKNHAHEENFVLAQLLALDFENPDVAMADVQEQVKDCWHIIGTTKNHQREKNGKEACDRFRLVMRWERPITDLDEYRYNTRKQAKKYGADLMATDGARRFAPCTAIVAGNGDYDPQIMAWDIDVDACPLSHTASEKAAKFAAKAAWAKHHYKKTGRLPEKIEAFVFKGILTNDESRNLTCYSVACTLFGVGMNEREIYDIINDAPFDRTDFPPREIQRCIVSASKTIEKEKKGLPL